MIKRDCEHYDFGKTAPSEYGAFCSFHRKWLEHNNCSDCQDYDQKEDSGKGSQHGIF